MKIETILNAMLIADRRRIAPAHIAQSVPNAQRQHKAFRARILRMDAEKDERITKLEKVQTEYLAYLMESKR